MKSALAALALLGLVAGCGGDGILIISFTSGIIDGDPTCRTNGGQFDLRDQGGLTVLVIITNTTSIFVRSTAGTCRDLSPNDNVTVRGTRQGDRITAQSVQVE